MFFSKVVVHVQEMELRMLSELVCANEGYRIHQAVWRLFEDTSITRRDFLYRYENEQARPVFYMVSRREPKPHYSSWEIHTKPYAPKVRAGEQLAFSLRANPVRAGKGEKDGKYARHDVVMAAKTRLRVSNVARDLWPLDSELVQAEGVAWLESRAEGCGFRMNADEVRADGYQQHRLSRHQGKPIRFSTVDYQGLLTVADPEKFVGTLLGGIGHCKAFGCGMLMVRRT